VRNDGHPATHRTTALWMGEPVLTLEDVWPAQPCAVIVGLNPTPTSVEAGHYYQGRLGERQLLRLADAGLFRKPDSGCTYFERAALEARIGVTDVVKRPTCAEKHVSRREIEFGRTALNAALEARRFPLVLCVFRHPVAVLLGSSGRPGFQPETTTWGARVFRLPGPFAPADEVRDVMADLSQGIPAAP
jgi:double-stranded uracil-DNA glycosylase